MVGSLINRIKILIIIPFLKGGGAERVISILINNLSRDKFDIHVALIATQGVPVENIHPEITVYPWNNRRASRGVFRLVRLLHDLQPDVVLSTLGYVNILVMLLRPFFPKRTKFIARESNIPSLHLKQFAQVGFMKFLYRMLYPKFDLVLCQSLDMKKDIIENFNIHPSKTTIINNPVDTVWISKKLVANNKAGLLGNVKLLAVGKLMPQKGFDLLLEAFSLLDDDGYNLTIIGEGTERQKLYTIANDLGLTNRVKFSGYIANPYPAMEEADIFILSSRYEGFPNVVLEANACGTPVVAFNCPGGISEIIQNGFNGWLVEPGNVNALASTIAETAKKSFDRAKIKKYISDKYGVKKILPLYESVIENMVKIG